MHDDALPVSTATTASTVDLGVRQVPASGDEAGYVYDSPHCRYATNSGIKITDDGLEHIVDRHTAFGTSTAHKSVFFDGEDITSLIRRAEGTTPIPQPGGNLAYVVHGDDVLGVDIATGLPTDIYTVITKSDGTLVTAFPGLPTGGR